MTAAFLDMRPTSESAVGPSVAGAASNLVLRPAPRSPHRRRLVSHWRPDRDGHAVCVWGAATDSRCQLH